MDEEKTQQEYESLYMNFRSSAEHYHQAMDTLRRRINREIDRVEAGEARPEDLKENIRRLKFYSAEEGYYFVLHAAQEILGMSAVEKLSSVADMEKAVSAFMAQRPDRTPRD